MTNLIPLALILLGSPAQAASFEVGLGLRDAHYQSWRFEGFRATGRWVNRGWALEWGLYGTPFAHKVSDLGKVVLAIGDVTDGGSDLRYPDMRDTWSTDVRLDLGARPRDREQRFAGGPHLYLGFEARYMERYALAYHQLEGAVVDTVELTMGMGPTIGIGLDAWYKGRVGLRLVVQDRTWWGDEDVYQAGEEPSRQHLHHDPTTSIDLLVAF